MENCTGDCPPMTSWPTPNSDIMTHQRDSFSLTVYLYSRKSSSSLGGSPSTASTDAIYRSSWLCSWFIILSFCCASCFLATEGNRSCWTPCFSTSCIARSVCLLVILQCVSESPFCAGLRTVRRFSPKTTASSCLPPTLLRPGSTGQEIAW